MGAELFTELTAPNGVRYTQPLGLFINNQWASSKGNDKITSINPTDESEICTVIGANAEDIEDAVKAARHAYEAEWRDTDSTLRGELLNKLAILTEQHADVLATIETWDNGKTFHAARNEDLPDSIGVLKYYAGWADKLSGQLFSNNPQKLSYTIREPLGVCAAIVPWNFPLNMAVTKIAPAVAAGNTVVLKLAEQTPLSTLYFANLVKEAGFPPGVINIVNGFGRSAGARLIEHPDVNIISFTGSTPTGKSILKSASGTIKRVLLETGGKSPMIILDDADLEKAVHWAHSGIMSNQGQVCSATSRLLVQEGIYDKFISRYKQKVQEMKVGNPFDKDTFQGPQVTRAQYEKILSYVDSGKQEGATLALGGVADKNVNGSQGLFISPTIFTDVSETMKIFQEEIFGPFLVVSKFKNIDDAIRVANNTTFGLGSAVFTRDITKAHKIARKIEAGTVWINSSNDADFRVPFGGYKQSGLGYELGEQGILSYTACKSVHVNLESKL